MLLDREGALEALERAGALGAEGELRDLLAQALALEPRMSRSRPEGLRKAQDEV